MASGPWISNGGVGVALKTSSSWTRTSIAPVLSLGFSLPGEPGGDGPPDADDVLVAELARRAPGAPAGLGLEDDLGQAVAVAEVDEDQPAEVAPGVHPAVEDDRLPDVVGRQFAAGMCPFEHGRPVVSEESASGPSRQHAAMTACQTASTRPILSM